MESIRKTVLSESHIQLGARMVDFSGWYMPLQYDGILAEHHRTRTDVTMFDTCHMGRFLVTGPGSLEALNALLTTDLNTLHDGQCKYGFLLREDGGILDDLITYRFDAGHWMIVVNAGTQDGDREWIQSRLPASVTFTDVSRTLAKIDVQGPRALDCVAQVCGIEVASLGYFRFRTFACGGEAIVSRTGYTGEKGVELYVESTRMVELWHQFLADGVKPAGLGARDTLRLEAGLPLYGHELSEAVTPVEAAMMRYVTKASPYVGREAVLQHQAQGPATILVGFKIEGRQSARAGQAVVSNGRPVGTVTSGSFGPTLQVVVGFASVSPACSAVGTRLQVDTGRALLEAVIVKPPFYKAV
ncbi:MAG: glycine cleavage system aminomethyltransferase GcvT [bacterium]